MKTFLTASALASMLFVSGAALAQTAPAPAAAPAAATSDHTFSGEVRITNDYRYRGISQTNFAPAVQGEFDYAHSSGLYIGTWASNISWIGDANQGTKTSAPIEMDLYGGYKGELVKGLNYDVGVLQYYYPGKNLPSVSPNTTELYVSASYGLFTGKYSHSVTNLFGIDGTKGSGYWEGEVAYPVGWQDIKVKGHVGYQHVMHNKDASYVDWKVGLNKGLPNGFEASLYYVGTNSKKAFYTSAVDGKNLGKGTVVAALIKTF